MEKLLARLADWLSREISDNEFSCFVVENEEVSLQSISRQEYLKLKHLDRGAGRELLNKLKPCEVCGKRFEGLDEFQNLDKEEGFAKIDPEDCMEDPSQAYSAQDLIFQWRCKECGSVVQLITEEKSSFGRWEFVG